MAKVQRTLASTRLVHPFQAKGDVTPLYKLGVEAEVQAPTSNPWLLSQKVLSFSVSFVKICLDKHYSIHALYLVHTRIHVKDSGRLCVKDGRLYLGEFLPAPAEPPLRDWSTDVMERELQNLIPSGFIKDSEVSLLKTQLVEAL
ncbi:hypothetical protein RND71_038372 [Anisodus tanguticus]|uniref:Uncharacterized protein n=1 Tax=Anisodus tanguticus TaxID=243964 RepID=A0AAE1R0A4_9SOLA|nr:hypothetical protein RND71_038372 [Anisodus tanguticus]